jgi:hypothetical protein
VLETDKQRLSSINTNRLFPKPSNQKPSQDRNGGLALLFYSILSRTLKITSEIVNQTPFSLFISPKIQAD